MRYSIAAITALLGLALSEITSPLEGYTVVEPVLEIEVVPGQPPVAFNGSIQDVLIQLEADYPDVAARMHDKITAFLETAAAEGDAVPPPPETSPAVPEALTKRDHNICFNFPPAREVRMKENIAYLYGVSGRPWLAPGPQKCARVSCAWDAAVWWCNDNNYRVELGSYGDIANAATVCQRECRYFVLPDGTQNPTGYGWFNSGQRFHDGGVNVIIRGDTC